MQKKTKTKVNWFLRRRTDLQVEDAFMYLDDSLFIIIILLVYLD